MFGHVFWIAAYIGIIVSGIFFFWSAQPAPNTRISTTIKDCRSATISERLEAADVVLIARVIIVVPGEQYAEVYLEPDRLYKGSLARPWRIFANDQSTRSLVGQQGFSQVRIDGQVENEINFTSHQAPYLLFLRTTDGGYLTSRCDGSRLLGDGLTDEEKIALGVVQ